MKKIIFPIFLGVAILVCFGVCFGKGALAYQIEDLPDTEVKGDIVLGPTKLEFYLDPGEKASTEIMVTNRTGRTVNFGIGTEDFKGSRNLDQTVIFLGPEKGPYSLKDWLKPELDEFVLKHGQRIHLPIEISIPQDADPGGHYGVVFAMAKPPTPQTEAEKEAAKSQVSIVSRAGTLFFVRINGKVNEDGHLTGLTTAKKFYERGPIPFQVIFENNGSVHLAPHGMIEIRNILGKKVGEVTLDTWFVMPDSLRLREVTWEKGLLFGKYTALASVYRGYQGIIDQKSVEFWVIPWKIVLVGLIILVLVILFIYWIATHFEFRRKTPTTP